MQQGAPQQQPHWAASVVVDAQQAGAATTPAAALHAAHASSGQQWPPPRSYYNYAQQVALQRQRIQQQAPQQASSATQLPPSLKTYAERAFATCRGEAARTLMQKKLHELMSSAIRNKTLHATDWDAAPIPDIYADADAVPRRRQGSSPVVPASASSSSSAAPSSRNRSSHAGGGEELSARRTQPKKKASPNKSQRRGMSREELAQLDARAKRFDDPSRQKRRKTGATTTSPLGGGDDAEWRDDDDVGVVVGTCEALEKDYFRLTSAPDPADVRPERVLSAALSKLKHKWKHSLVDYDWACNQLKAIRQDVTVQGLTKTPFAVNVYETHARIALENADMNEYNQCQTQLKELHAGVAESRAAGASPRVVVSRHAAEFLAYRILYYLWLASTKRGDANAELLNILRDIPAETWTDPAVAHALDVRRALHLGDYATFFRRYRDVPNMGAFVLDQFVDNVRLDAATKIIRAYRPTTTLPALRRQLGFFDDDDEREADAFISKLGFKLDGDTVLLKDSTLDPAALRSEDKPNSLL